MVVVVAAAFHRQEGGRKVTSVQASVISAICWLWNPLLEVTPWPEERHERISINSFGIGGSNAHCIIKSAASFHLSKVPRSNTLAPLAPLAL